MLKRNNEQELARECVKWFKKTYPAHSFKLVATVSLRDIKASYARKYAQDGASKGLPRLFFMLPSSTCHGVWIDIKAPNTTRIRKTMEQRMFQMKSAETGYPVHTVNSLASFKSIAESCVYRHVQMIALDGVGKN